MNGISFLPPAYAKHIEEGRSFAQEFYAKSLKPILGNRDGLDKEEITVQILTALNKHSFFRYWLPVFLGGKGGSYLHYLGFSQELSKHSLGVANILGAHFMALSMISATDDLRIIKRLALEIKRAEKTSKPCVIAIAATEPDAGTDMEDVDLIQRAKVVTKAQKVDGGFILNGSKQFISNASYAEWFVVTAFEDVGKPSESVVIAAAKKQEGRVVLGRLEEKLGQELCPSSPVFLENCFVPDDWVALEKRQFFDENVYLQFSKVLLMDVLTNSRVGVGTMALGVLGRTADHFQHWAQNKKWGNSAKLLDKQSTQLQLAKLMGEEEAAARMVWSVAYELASRGVYKDMHRRGFNLLDRFVLTPLLRSPSTKLRDSFRKKRLKGLSDQERKHFFGLSSLVKARVADAASQALRQAMNDMGAQGWVELEELVRDAKLLEIYEGSNALNLLNTFNQEKAVSDASFIPFEDPLEERGSFGTT